MREEMQKQAWQTPQLSAQFPLAVSLCSESSFSSAPSLHPCPLAPHLRAGLLPVVIGPTAVLGWAGHCPARAGAALTLQWQALPWRDVPLGGRLEKDTAAGSWAGALLETRGTGGGRRELHAPVSDADAGGLVSWAWT